MYISTKRHSWFFKSWWCLLYFGHVQTRTVGKCWLQKTPFCLKLSAHAQWHQKTPFCLKLSTHAQKSVLSLRILYVQNPWYYHQSGNAASGKLVWNQHNSAIKWLQLIANCGIILSGNFNEKMPPYPTAKIRGRGVDATCHLAIFVFAPNPRNMVAILETCMS